VQESEHRLSIGFRAATPAQPGGELAPLTELCFAARATASFPGAFPALQLAEIDTLAAEYGIAWPSRAAFIERVMPEHARRGAAEGASLIDGSILVNAPFAEAMSVLRDRPAQREVDRRFVYIDPRPDRVGGLERSDPHPPGWFSVIFGSLSSIPREQPVRDNLNEIARQSRERAHLSRNRGVAAARGRGGSGETVRPHPVPRSPDSETPRQLAQQGPAGRCRAGGLRLSRLCPGQVRRHRRHARRDDPRRRTGPVPAFREPIASHLIAFLATQGLDRISELRGGATKEAIAFFTEHDLPFRIRRLRLLARRLTQDWDGEGGEVGEEAREKARDAVYTALSLYFERESSNCMGPEFTALAEKVFEDPGAALAGISDRRRLPETDVLVDAMLAAAMAEMPTALRRRMLLAYLGYPFYDAATLPLLRGEGLTEFDPVKVDRISPDDARSIRAGGTHATLRGVEFYNFGAFFSRAYRENDYLWGRLHGAERMIDLVASTLPDNATLSGRGNAGLQARSVPGDPRRGGSAAGGRPRTGAGDPGGGDGRLG
jgi:patatin-related protein